MGQFSFDRAWLRTLPTKLAGVRSAVAALGLVVALTSPSHAQAPSAVLASFGVLCGSTCTNTGTSVITGNVGVSPGTAITGFPPGIASGTIYSAGAVPLQAQVDNTTFYNYLASRPTTQDLTGQNLGGLTLVPGVYNFSSSAQLTGLLTLNGPGNYIINIGSTLTTASASRVLLENGALGGNVFWRVGSSATIGTTTSFVGDILAMASITLTTGATINCGAAWAQTGAVTLDTNTIAICSALVPSTTTLNTLNTSAAITAVVAATGTLPPALLDTLVFLSPSQLAVALTQISGELGTGAAQAGTEAMNPFLSLLTNPFSETRGIVPEIPLPARPVLIFKAPIYKAPVAEAAPDPRRWSIWAATYGGQYRNSGDPSVGSHDFSATSFGVAAGLDYRVTPNTVVGFALGGGSANYGLSDNLGGGHSNIFQAAVYSTTRINAAYVSAALAYAWNHVSTARFATLAGTDNLTANFDANDIGGRIEGGYRFAIPGVFGLPGFGLTPYAALQVQAFRTPSYSEIAASGSSTLALAYNAQTTTTTRGELGSWVDKTYVLNSDSVLTLFGRAAWAHDWFTDPSIMASLVSLPGSIFTVYGAVPAKDSALLSAGSQLSMRNGWSVMAKLDTEFARHSQTYIGTAQLRYTW
jgi:uncharacterized protein with beta-barrel porin domain